MLDLNEYRKFITTFIPDITDMELYDAINHTEIIYDNISRIKVRGISFTFNSSTYELYEYDYGANPPTGVGVGIYERKDLDDKIDETGYEFP